MPTHTTAADVLAHIARLERQADRIAHLQERLDAGHRRALPANAARKGSRGPRRRRNRR